MKYAIGTKCWVVSRNAPKSVRGEIVVVTDHECWEDPDDPCETCRALSRDSTVGIDYLGKYGQGCEACCHCALIPIDDPDAADATHEQCEDKQRENVKEAV